MYNKLSDYLKKIYGKKLTKLVLSGGMTCPNRDGTCGTKGCIFCSSGGSGEFAQDATLSVNDQIENAKQKLTQESTDEQYIAYFQPFTNTYQSVSYLRKLYEPVVNRDDIAVLSIATRPDCLSDETVDLLAYLNKIKPVWVELGLQTIHDSTALKINRGYPLSVYIDAVSKLKAKGINVITHLILGLPGESKVQMVESARLVGGFTDGVKFHLLYVAKDTQLEDMYRRNEYTPLCRDEYIDILCDCIRVTPENVTC